MSKTLFETQVNPLPMAPSVSPDAEKARLDAAKSARQSMPGSNDNIVGGARVASDDYGKNLLAKKAL